MKMKKEAVVAAIAFAAALNLSACVYGPPNDDFEQDPPTEENTFTPDENQNTDSEEEYEDATQPKEKTPYDPADNVNGDVYGPPIDQ